MPIARVRECRSQLERTADLAQYTTTASVDDLEDIRAALQYDALNLVGASYGSRLAMEYVREYGPHVRTVILEGAVPPAFPVPEGFGRTAQTALDGVLDECLRDPACARSFPDIKKQSTSVFDRLRYGPVTAWLVGSTTGQIAMSRDHVAESIRYMLYSSRNASRVPQALHAAYEGDFAPVAEFLHRWRGDGSFDALYLSVTCAEDVPFVRDDAAEQDDPTFLGGYRVRQQRAACAEWPRGAIPPARDAPVRSDVPALIISGTLDPVTPPRTEIRSRGVFRTRCTFRSRPAVTACTV
jgi:pimeloyl-ACP methyl ester carboxylesterase